MKKAIKKSTSLIVIFAIIMAIGGFIVMTQHQVLLVVAGAFCIITGFIPVSYIWIEMAGQPKMYKFVHYYKNSNTLDNETTYLKKISWKDKTQLMDYDKDVFNNLMNKQPIFVESLEALGLDAEGETRIIGFVIAHDKAEAKRNLHYVNSFDEYK
jgi:hypothetical protein